MTKEINISEILNRFGTNDPERYEKTVREVLRIHSTISDSEKMELIFDVDSFKHYSEEEIAHKIFATIRTALPNIEIGVSLFLLVPNEGQAVYFDMGDKQKILSPGDSYSISNNGIPLDIRLINSTYSENLQYSQCTDKSK